MFEEVLKQHCVADMNVSVYDGVDVVDRVVDGRGVRGVLTDGTSRLGAAAPTCSSMPTGCPATLSEAIVAGAAAALDAIGVLVGRPR